MALYKNIIIGALILITIILSVNFALNLWIYMRLPEILSDRNKSPYHITYNDLTMDLWTRNFKATDVVIVPKSKNQNAKLGLYANIGAIEINRFNILDLLFSDKIFAERITFTAPNILLYKRNAEVIRDPRNIGKGIVEPFTKIISVSNIFLEEGEVKIIDINTNKRLLSATNINLHLEGVIITNDILKNKIPFDFLKYGFSCDSLYYKPNEFYHIKAQNIYNKKAVIFIKKFSLLPEYSRKNFVQQLKKEKDLFNVTANSIQVRNLRWGFKEEELFVNARALAMEEVSAKVFRSKIPPDDLKKKLLYNSQLRKIPFTLRLDTLMIRNSRLTYEEEIDEKGSGILTFSKLNLLAQNIQSGYVQKIMPDVKIDLNCRFMETSPLRLKWSFNVQDSTDGFKVKGTIINFDTEKISPFFKLYTNITAKGVFDEVSFDIKGNDFVSNVDCTLKYHDFKLTFYKKDQPEKKSKLKTTIAGLLIKNDSDGKYKKATAKVRRFQEKSFYNFLWRTIAEGVKEIVL